jgi:SAM-dependent MidA family methyltransferase
MSLADRLVDEIRAHGPLTVEGFMERALYDPAEGYYSTAVQRSGRTGDFFTSVDAGPLFGQLIAELAARVWAQRGGAAFDLVEAGAGNGRLTGDVLDALKAEQPECYRSVRVTLVERSPAARRAHGAVAARHSGIALGSTAAVPAPVSGFLFANELLDAMPVHRVVQTRDGLREVYVTAEASHLALVLGPLSDPALGAYFESAGVTLPEGVTADISPAAVAWTAAAARHLDWGAILLIDYGAEAAELFSARHPDGTLVSYARHQLDPASPRASRRCPAWLEAPGQRDLTAHVDFTSVGRAAERGGARRGWLVDQTRLLLGLGLADRLSAVSGTGVDDVRWRLAAKTLAAPHGIGASHRALLVSKGIDGTRLLRPVSP